MRLITASLSLLLFTLAGHGQDRTEYIAKIKHTPALSIPDEAKKTGLGGEISVRVNLDLDGNVVRVESVAGPGSICGSVTRKDVVVLRRSAEEAAKLAKFEPVIEDGKRKHAAGFVRFDVPVGTSDQITTDVKTINLGYLGQTNPDGSENFLKRMGIDLPRPVYPPTARILRATGGVSVTILIDETGNVFSAQAASGHPFLRQAAAQAACRSRFQPTLVGGEPVKVAGSISYVFMP